MNTAEITHYWDVWGNEEDGWQVNDVSRLGTLTFEDTSREGVWAKLVEEGIATGKFEEAEFEEHGSGYYISEAKNGRPVFDISGLW